ncbi:MAG: hypothetical protein ACREJC_15725 [Tepidisphaeraceae bacterium]
MWLKSKAIWGGLILIANGLIGIGDAAFDADPATVIDWNAALALIGNGLGVLGIRLKLPKPGEGQ